MYISVFHTVSPSFGFDFGANQQKVQSSAIYLDVYLPLFARTLHAVFMEQTGPCSFHSQPISTDLLWSNLLVFVILSVSLKFHFPF